MKASGLGLCICCKKLLLRRRDAGEGEVLQRLGPTGLQHFKAGWGQVISAAPLLLVIFKGRHRHTVWHRSAKDYLGTCNEAVFVFWFISITDALYSLADTLGSHTELAMRPKIGIMPFSGTSGFPSEKLWLLCCFYNATRALYEEGVAYLLLSVAANSPNVGCEDWAGEYNTRVL